MNDSLSDMFLKEHEKYLPIHAVMQASASKPKTPYQIDLEVKDRKPIFVPKVGDMVKIKSREWYEKWKDASGLIRFTSTKCVFIEPMKELCGKTLTVTDIIDFAGERWLLDLDIHLFVPEFFEEVYPVQEQLSSKFPKIDLNSPYLYQSPYGVKGGALVLSKEEQERLKGQFFLPCSEREKDCLEKQSLFAAKVEETAKRLTAYTLVQGLTAKPKLKQVKTTHLIKLKKL